MSYTPPKVDAAGLHIPSFQDYLDILESNFLSIFGQTISLDNSTSDVQMLNNFALMLSDAAQGLQLAYNNRSPVTSVGGALDTIVKINGIARKKATFSSCTVILTGTALAVIINGVVQDVNGNLWNLPASVTIGGGGTVSVTAVCQNAGAVSALVNQITTISTPQAGWASVTNAVPASVGQPLETDGQLRGRQALSVELPSQTILAGTIAAVAAVPSVTRFNVDENFTGATNANGNPPHSITVVVEGGIDADIAQAIFNNRGIGPLTNGTTTVNVTDPNTSLSMPISFDRPTSVAIWVSLTIHPLTGYTSAAAAAVVNALVSYLNSLQIGEILTIGGLYATAMGINPSLTNPQFSVRALTLGTAPGPVGTSDIAMAFNQVATSIAANIVVTVS